jgi:hypothetical protein
MANDSGRTDALLADIQRRLVELVAAARQEGKDGAVDQIRSMLGGTLGLAVAPVKRGPGRPRKNPLAAPAAPKAKKARRNPWAHLTEEQKAERVRKMQEGRKKKPS